MAEWRDLTLMAIGIMLAVLLLLERAPDWAFPVAWGGGLLGGLAWGRRWPVLYTVSFLLGTTAYFGVVGVLEAETSSHIVGDVFVGWFFGVVPAGCFASLGAWLAPRLG